MLTMLAEQIEEVRRRIDEPIAQKISNNYIIRCLADGQDKLSEQVYVNTNDMAGYSSVLNQDGYTLPTNYININQVVWQIDVSHYPLGRMDYMAITQSLPQQGDPAYYAIDEARKRMVLMPIPQGNAQTTTLSSSVAVGDTTINVTSTTGFGGLGYIQIDSEIIQYTAVNTAGTQFTGCVRGVAGTTASSHNNAATVYWIDIMVYYTRLPKKIYRYRSTDTVTFTNGSTTVTGTGTNWISGVNIYAGQYIGLGSFSTVTSNESFPIVWYQIASIGSSTSLTLVTAYQEATSSTPSLCIITDQSELYEQDCTIPITWAEYLCQRVLGNKDKQENARLAFSSAMDLAKERRNGPDNLMVIRTTKFANNMASQIIRAPAHFERFNF
jgi:hypothetical protein